MNRKTSTLIGTGLGLAVFLAVGLLPSMLYGGYAGVMLAGGILGSPLRPTFVAKSLIVFGMLLGTVGVGALFSLAGAVCGAAAHALAQPVRDLLPQERSE